MSLRILFADDSVTAQNMGRKILTDAGYEVVAVSNGAAAVKKIAEQKPDIIILDVYMPGYSGLEVCEKVRGSVATLKTPVLLTVGKMEPYRAEETSRVRADGVIVKPFEASDLLAIVKKFEERLGQEPLAPKPAGERLYESAPEELHEEFPVEHPEPAFHTTPQATVDVPDHMATSSAFSDLLGTDSAHSMNNFSAPPAPVVRETPPPPAPSRSPIPEYDVPVSWRERIEDKAEPFSAAIPAKGVTDAPADSAARPPLRIPAYQEQVEAPAPAEVVPTAMPPTGEIEIPREPELQETAAVETRSTVADVREPGLVPTLHEESAQLTAREAAATSDNVTATDATPPESDQIRMPSFADALASAPTAEPARREPAAARAARAEESAPVVTETPGTEAGSIAAEKSAATESDFEARVAAAMAAYNTAPESEPGEAAIAGATVEATPAVMPAAPAEAGDATSPQISEAPATSEPSYDYHPPAAYTEPAAVAAPVTEPAPLAPAAAEPERIATATAAASLEAAVPMMTAAAAAAGAEADHQTIAQAVYRAMERLKPQLVEQILRELKSKE